MNNSNETLINKPTFILENRYEIRIKMWCGESLSTMRELSGPYIHIPAFPPFLQRNLPIRRGRVA